MGFGVFHPRQNPSFGKLKMKQFDFRDTPTYTENCTFVAMQADIWKRHGASSATPPFTCITPVGDGLTTLPAAALNKQALQTNRRE